MPKTENFGLTSQIRRAALSIPGNIAEGYGRKTTPEYLRSLHMAYGSTGELETQVLLSGERMIKALINSLEKRLLNP
ncbi:MAG: four helix bundle protein [Thermodesulfobacteriota bacterium]